MATKYVNSQLKAITDDWYLCYSNFIPEVRNQFTPAKKISLADCTLRDGEQQAGIVFTWEDKVKIAAQLDRAGMTEIEAGTPASSPSDEKAAREIVKLNTKSKITALSRATKEDIDLMCDIGVWGANISLPIGDLQRKYKLKWDDEKYINTCLEITEYARSKGLHVNLSPFDTTRCDLDFLDKVLAALKNSGNVDRVKLVDTVGSAIPEALTYMVRRMKKTLKDTPIEVHVHNDFGMGVANTTAALMAGAEVASTSMNGLGERCGNASTEQLALALQMLYGIDIGIDSTEILKTAQLISELSGVPIPQFMPITGRNAFSHETGMAVAGLLSMSYTAEAYNPAIVGQERHILLGKKSGKASVEAKLDELKMTYNTEQVEELLAEIKEFATQRKRCLTDEEFADMADKKLR